LHNSFSEKLLPCKTGALLATFRKLLLTAALFQLLLKDPSALRQNRNLLFHNFSQRFSSIGGNSSHICNLFQDSTLLLKSSSLLYFFQNTSSELLQFAICYFFRKIILNFHKAAGIHIFQKASSALL
jgi:hypothetical protein